MQKYLLSLMCGMLFMSSQTGFANEPVVKDGNTELHLEELRLIVDSWTPEMKEAAATDDAALYNLLNQAVAIKKMAQQAEEMTPEKDGVDYWRKEMAKQKTMQVFIFRQFTDSLVVPDLTALAKERYQTQKKKYAWIPEKRQSSHILLRCAPPKCLWQSRGEEMKEIQAELDIMPFEDVARNRSEDVGTARKGGSLSLAVALTDPQVDKAYRKALFELEKVGQVSPMVGSSFGLHLIRLDAIEEGYFRPYNQVRDAIVSDITTEYKKMKVREYNESFRFTDETSIDDAAMRELLAPYKD